MLALALMRSYSLLLLALFISACTLSPGISGNDQLAKPTLVDSFAYEVTQSITLSNDGDNQPEKHHIWIALITDRPPFQSVTSRDIQPALYELITDEHGNEFAEFDLKNIQPGQKVTISIHYEVIIRELSFDISNCKGELPDEYNQPELHIESKNPQIIKLAEQLSDGENNLCNQVRNYYNYLGDTLVYSYNGADWGAQAALGTMGADCTEYSSLLIALSRANGIPARYVEGLLFLDDNATDVARREHAWVELYVPGTGWTPFDPTLGRLQSTREDHFAKYTANHIIVTKGRNPSTLRGASYWSHLYWPGDSTSIHIENAEWSIMEMPYTVTS